MEKFVSKGLRFSENHEWLCAVFLFHYGSNHLIVVKSESMEPNSSCVKNCRLRLWLLLRVLLTTHKVSVGSSRSCIHSRQFQTRPIPLLMLPLFKSIIDHCFKLRGDHCRTNVYRLHDEFVIARILPNLNLAF